MQTTKITMKMTFRWLFVGFSLVLSSSFATSANNDYNPALSYGPRVLKYLEKRGCGLPCVKADVVHARKEVVKKLQEVQSNVKNAQENIIENLKKVEMELSSNTKDLNTVTKEGIVDIKSEVDNNREKIIMDAAKTKNEIKAKIEDVIARQNEAKEKIEDVLAKQNEAKEKIEDVLAKQNEAQGKIEDILAKQNEAIMDLQKQVNETKMDMATISSNLQEILKYLKENRWTLIQRHNFIISSDFQKNGWQEYKDGFQSSNGDTSYWMGLEEMHRLTTSPGSSWNLRVQIKYDKNQDGSTDPRRGTWGTGEWTNFKIGSEADGFRLTIGGRISSKNMAGSDPFNSHPLNQRKFSTHDRGTGSGCAKNYGGGWWFLNCARVCLNCDRSSSLKQIWYDGTNRFPSESLMFVKRVV